MQKQVFILFFSCLLCSCNTTINTKSNKNNFLEIKKDKIFDAWSGKEIHNIIINDIVFQFQLTENMDLSSLSTRDERFITKEGYHVGTKWNDLTKKIQDSIYKLPGYGYIIELDSGWNLGFCEGNSCTDNFPNNFSEVKWISKRFTNKKKI